jgi:biopolymer transport protein ExbD
LLGTGCRFAGYWHLVQPAIHVGDRKTTLKNIQRVTRNKIRTIESRDDKPQVLIFADENLKLEVIASVFEALRANNSRRIYFVTTYKSRRPFMQKF